MERAELKKIIDDERWIYYLRKNKSEFICRLTHDRRYMIWKYIYYFRMYQYWNEKMCGKNGISKKICRLVSYYYLRRKNITGEKCGVEIANNCTLGKNINIFHGGVIISGAKIGDNCTIRGNTVIGNKGLKKYNGEPTIGNNVEIGAGANIIGNITIADGCEIGANSVVTKSVLEPNSIIVGVPGRIFERK
ncbi:MAG: hypothetical protein PUA89_05125 [Frisingicoccus sp.]|uniref:serine O-acetyltransferase n=1 Tax=Frisingicoccus sp. TaxID=1918627 RepID=UPI00261CC6A5|nr:hypothetical protein [Frisingicoccus sp.]MDD6232081.1 hypothetical protein [Frisingicoccus sp.]